MTSNLASHEEDVYAPLFAYDNGLGVASCMTQKLFQ